MQEIVVQNDSYDEVLKFDEMTNKHNLCIRGKI